MEVHVFLYTYPVNGQAVGKMNLEFFLSLFTMLELLEFFRAMEVLVSHGFLTFGLLKLWVFGIDFFEKRWLLLVFAAFNNSNGRPIIAVDRFIVPSVLCGVTRTSGFL